MGKGSAPSYMCEAPRTSQSRSGDLVPMMRGDRVVLVPAATMGGGGGQGPQGPAGPQGPQGDIGPQGPAGAQGIQGPAGADGAQGAQGIQGIQGIQGPAGASVLALNLVSDGVAVTWTNMPAAATFFTGSHRFVTKADLTDFTQVRLIVNKQDRKSVV